MKQPRIVPHTIHTVRKGKDGKVVSNAGANSRLLALEGTQPFGGHKTKPIGRPRLNPDELSTKVRRADYPVKISPARQTRMWRNSIISALRRRSRVGQIEELERIADKLITLAKSGSIPAIRELGDRLDGRAPLEIRGDPENPLYIKAIREMTDDELEMLARPVIENSP